MRCVTPIVLYTKMDAHCSLCCGNVSWTKLASLVMIDVPCRNYSKFRVWLFVAGIRSSSCSALQWDVLTVDTGAGVADSASSTECIQSSQGPCPTWNGFLPAWTLCWRLVQHTGMVKASFKGRCHGNQFLRAKSAKLAYFASFCLHRIKIWWSVIRQWVAVASAGPYANLHLNPDTQPRQHPTTQFFYGLDALPAAQPTASEHWRYLAKLTIIPENKVN